MTNTNLYPNAGTRSPFSGPILALLWIFQLLFLSTAVATLALLVGTLKTSPFILLGSDDEFVLMPGFTPTYVTLPSPTLLLNQSKKQKLTTANPSRPYIVMLCIASLLTLITCMEIIAYFNRDLTPPLYLYTTLFKTLAWFVVVGLDVWSITRPWIWSFKEDVPKVITFYRIYLWVMLGGAVGVL